jgi:ClpX C4-type zinc finger
MINEQEQVGGPSCSFCARPGTPALVLIEGPDKTHICEECVDTCVSYLPRRSKTRVLATLLSPWRWHSRYVKPRTPRTAAV